MTRSIRSGLSSLTPVRDPRRRATRRRPLALLALGMAVAAAAACGGDPGGEVDPYPAPHFSLQDLNPASSSYLDTLSTEDASGDVLVLYFASFT